MLEIQEAPATIITGFDPSVSTFASNAVDFLVKPFDAERLDKHWIWPLQRLVRHDLRQYPQLV
jgi:FixJ family two-component response regulator